MPLPETLGFRYYCPINAGAANVISGVDLASSTFDFTKAQETGADVRVYDVEADSILPCWLFDFKASESRGRVEFLTTNTAHTHRVYFGNPTATTLSNHNTVYSGGTGFFTDWGDFTTVQGGGGFTAQIPEITSQSDPRNFRVWSRAEADLLDYAMTGLGGTYSGVREASLIRDPLTNKPLLIGGFYYITFARRSAVATDKFDCVIAKSANTTGPWSSYSVFYTPPGTIRLGYPSSVLKVGSTYVCHVTYGWDTSGTATPGLSVYVMTSTDLVTWTSPVQVLLPGVFTDPNDSSVCTNIGNPWVFRCNDGTYMMSIEGMGSSAKWGCFGATAVDPIAGPWTPLNSGLSLMSIPASGDWDFGGTGDANPKVMQVPDGSYVMMFNGSNNPAAGDSNWRIGFSMSASRAGPYVKATWNPVAGRPTPSYGVEACGLHYNIDGSILAWIQRFGDDPTGSSQAKIYALTPLTRRGGLIACEVSTTDAAYAGKVIAASGTFTLETRSSMTARTAVQATPNLLALMDYATLPAVGPNAGFTPQRRVEIVRWSEDFTAANTGPGDISIKYYDTANNPIWWNGSTWNGIGVTTGRNIAADLGREVIARMSDDGTNFVMTVSYADTGAVITTASIAKASVHSFAAGRAVVIGDLFTDAWSEGLFLRYVHQGPLRLTDPALTLAALVDTGPSPTPTPTPTPTGPAISYKVQEGCSIDYTPGADLAAGDVVDLGTWIGIAEKAIAANELGILHVRGTYSITKNPGEAIAFGASTYWNNTAKTITATGPADATAGKCVKAALAGDATVLVKLTPGLPT